MLIGFAQIHWASPQQPPSPGCVVSSLSNADPSARGAGLGRENVSWVCVTSRGGGGKPTPQETLSCSELAASIAREKETTWKTSSLQDANPFKTGGGDAQGNYRAEKPSLSPWRLAVGLPPATRSQAADAQLLGAGKFTLPSGAGSGCQSPGQYMIMGL